MAETLFGIVCFDFNLFLGVIWPESDAVGIAGGGEIGLSLCCYHKQYLEGSPALLYHILSINVCGSLRNSGLLPIDRNFAASAKPSSSCRSLKVLFSLYIFRNSGLYFV
jgi:hypothetical protein